MSYYKQDDSIDTFKLNHATFQIALVNANTYTYRFIFNGSSDLSDSHANNYLQIGNNISTKFHHDYVDFKLLVPNDYHQGYNSSEEYKNSMRNLINSYVYDGKTNINQVTSHDAVYYKREGWQPALEGTWSPSARDASTCADFSAGCT